MGARVLLGKRAWLVLMACKALQGWRGCTALPGVQAIPRPRAHPELLELLVCVCVCVCVCARARVCLSVCLPACLSACLPVCHR